MEGGRGKDIGGDERSLRSSKVPIYISSIWTLFIGRMRVQSILGYLAGSAALLQLALAGT